MCRPQSAGGRRCPSNYEKREQHNKARRIAYKNKVMDKEASNISKEWGGTVSIDISDSEVKNAYNIAVVKHAGVRRKSGDAYIDHPLRVAKYLQDKGFSPKFVAVALIHDVVEDSDYTLEDLRKHGFDDTIRDGVDSVTKREGESAQESMDRAANNEIGTAVKMSDNTDNSSRSQLEFLTVKKRLKAEIQYTERRRVLWASIYQQSEENHG